MKIIAWSCRGLGNHPTVRSLLELQKTEQADMLFLSETKLDKRRMERFKWLLGLGNMVVRNCVGKGGGGGIAVLWRRGGVYVALRNFSDNHIDMDVSEADSFGTWTLLKDLKAQDDLPWLCARDFNEIMFQFEKEGGCPRTQILMDRFRETLDFCDLQDLGFEGDMFTWRNHQSQLSGYVRERLDWAVANIAWRNKFTSFQVINGDPRHSDHRPVIISTERREERMSRGVRPFFFEAGWLEDERCGDIVREGWELGYEEGLRKVQQLVGKVAVGLSAWNCNVLGEWEKRRKKLKRDLESCRRSALHGQGVAKEALLRFQLDHEEQIDIYWKQRPHVKWMEHGDRNTKFFHAACSERKQRNFIGRLDNGVGGWVEDEVEKEEFITNYFLQLFRSSAQGDEQQILQAVQPCVTEEMNGKLIDDFSAEEIKVALDGIGDLKAPGPDGMPAVFYKKFWDLVGNL